ncbi:regulation of nuclear pre-mRNA domain-containing protein 1B [Tanacetum coccineum]
MWAVYFNGFCKKIVILTRIALSHWCIFHRSKAEVVVTTWEKQFHSSEVAQKVPLLYLANDILQNSKRKGNEFVSEFWKVLPGALKVLIDKGDDHGKNVVSRLVNIWEERKVFGSRAKSIKDVLLGKELPQPLEFSKKRSRSVKIVKRDSRSIRTKLTIGSTAERIVSAFHLVVSEHHGEDEEMNKCKSAVHRVKKMEKDIDLSLTNGKLVMIEISPSLPPLSMVHELMLREAPSDLSTEGTFYDHNGISWSLTPLLFIAEKDPKRKTLSKELVEEENLLKQCIEKLKVVEANRVALVSQLRDALSDQESELENVRTQMQEFPPACVKERVPLPSGLDPTWLCGLATPSGLGAM